MPVQIFARGAARGGRRRLAYGLCSCSHNHDSNFWFHCNGRTPYRGWSQCWRRPHDRGRELGLSLVLAECKLESTGRDYDDRFWLVVLQYSRLVNRQLSNHICSAIHLTKDRVVLADVRPADAIVRQPDAVRRRDPRLGEERGPCVGKIKPER
eukprot:SAG11_NODE_3276_length_2559_cov_1.853252_3_plen_153_part_00